MSVRAYISRENIIWLDENGTVYTKYPNNSNHKLKEYIHTDKTFCFNLWSQSKVLDELMKFGASSYTNDDWVGEIEITEEDFNEFYLNNECTEEDDINSIEMMKQYFLEDENNWCLTLICM